MIHLAVIGAALALFAVLVGIATARSLAARPDEAGANEDAIHRAMHSQTRGRGSAAYVKELRNELPDALDMIANSLTAGLTLPQAILRNLEHFPPTVAAEFARILYDTSLGFSVAGAFDNFAARIPSRDAQMIAIASKIGIAHGGRLHENYRMLAGILRDKIAFEGELRAMTTEGRMQAIVMSCLPIVMMAILSFIRWELMSPLFTTAMGWATLCVLAGMQLTAYFWIKKIVSIEV